MKYMKADKHLPPALIETLQEYVQGGYIYIPAKADEHKAWGQESGSRAALDLRNAQIKAAYRNGASVEELAKKYYLSPHTIRKIIYSK